MLARVCSMLLLVGCQRAAAPAPTRSTPAPPAVAVPSSPVLPQASSESIYDLPVSLTDRTGNIRKLDSFRGAPVLVTMFYGSCATACPLLTVDLKRIEALLPPATRARVRVLMVSFDQARDTPSALERMTAERGLDTGRWTLASAGEDDARALAGVLGIKYRKLDNGEFFHSSAIVLIDEQGRPIARLDGLGKDASPIVMALRSSS